MKGLEDLHYDRLVDRGYVLRAAIGRPRTALWIGSGEGASLAEEVGARVVRGESVGSETFDLAFVSDSAGRGDLAPLVAGAAKRLGDGAHLVVDHRSGPSAAAVLDAIERAGLEPLWHGGVGPFASLSVARMRPEPRPLSLTVGMISMNEAGAVGGVIDSIRAACPEAEILLVDSSKDETPTIAEAKGARVLRQFPPRGYGPAMTRLLYSATTDVVVTIDCDGTYPVDRIRGLHAAVEAGADLVNASRTHARPSAMPLPNFVANRTFAAVAGLVHRFSTTDVHSGMRAYRTSMLRGIQVPEKGAALPVELLIIPARHGYRVEDVNIEYLERIGASTLQRWDSTIWTFRRIFRAAVNGGAAFD
jgi:Glycosyl transferase family 2